MHFNSLLMQLRTQALAAITGVITISGLAIGFLGKQTGRVGWRVVSGALLFVCLAWLALGVLDLLYYDRLLQGTVHAIVEHENRTSVLIDSSGPRLSKDGAPIHLINASTRIGENSLVRHEWIVACFYLIVWAGLLVGARYTWIKANAPEDPASGIGGAVS
jgi:xanthosine utilization system XapX-like protein